MLRGIGGAAVALPFLGAMLRPGRSHAQATDIPKRLVVVFRGNGVVQNRWFPTGTRTDFTLGASMAALRPFASDLVIFDGLDMVTAIERSGGRNPHDIGVTHCLTARAMVPGELPPTASGHYTDGSAGGPSLDQVVAARIGGETLFPSIALGARAGGLPHVPINHAFWRRRFEPITPIQDPGVAFDRIFAPLAGTDDARRDASASRRSIIDAVRGDLSALERRVDAEDRVRVQSHVDALSSLERRIAESEAAVCVAPERATSAGYAGTGRIHADLIAHSLACDLTRVATLQWSTGESRIRLPGHSDHHHALSHMGDSATEAQNQLAAFDRLYCDELAYLLGRLAELREVDGSRLLDHTVVLFVNELGKGNSHSRRRMPFLLAGSCGGAIRTGQYLRLDAAPHGDLYVSILRALGIDDATFGDPDFCRGPLDAVLA